MVSIMVKFLVRAYIHGKSIFQLPSEGGGGKLDHRSAECYT